MGVATCTIGTERSLTTYLRGNLWLIVRREMTLPPLLIVPRVPLSLSWGGKTISIDVYWFQYESDPSRNSNVYQVANKAVCDHFPGEFGSERLVQQVVAHILRVTENKEGLEQVSGHHPSQPADQDPEQSPEQQGSPLQSPSSSTDMTPGELQPITGVTWC